MFFPYDGSLRHFLYSVYTSLTGFFSHKAIRRTQNGGKERSGVFGVMSGDTTPTLQFKESVFNQMPFFIKLLIVSALLFAISFRRNNGLQAKNFRRFEEAVRVNSNSAFYSQNRSSALITRRVTPKLRRLCRGGYSRVHYRKFPFIVFLYYSRFLV
jgi:hypothetical protein